MKIGELALAAGTQIETVRYYERQGLLPEPERTLGNYRIYGDEHLERLSFIRQCRALDMNLEEVRALLQFKDAPQDNCAGVNELLDEHIQHVSERIKELRVLQSTLRALREQCAQPQGTDSCGILTELSKGTFSATASRPAVHAGHAHGAARTARPRRSS